MIEDLALKPAQGEFDLAAIQAHLDALPTARRDPQTPARYLLSSDPKAMARAEQDRRDGKSVPYSVAVLHPTPTIILLSTKTKDIQPSRDFIEWLAQQQDLLILDQEFNDFTADYKVRGLDAIFGPD